MQTRRLPKRALIVVHRWLGAALCLFFLLWFLSGIGMMYWEYPEISAADRLERAAILNAHAVQLTPVESLAKAGLSQLVSDARLAVFDGRPAYRFRSGRQETVVYADNGEVRAEITREMMLRIATAWVGQSTAPATIELIDDVDQWTIQLRRLAPLWKYAWPTGEHVYVSQSSGEVVQYTTTASRLGAYLGPIPHWLYFTPLRKHGPQWSSLVIWLSALGTATAMLGIIVGIWVSSPVLIIPYRGVKRLHTIFGLIFGVGAVTWAFSGMLSMDPFPLQPTGGSAPSAEVLTRAIRGNVRLTTFERKSPREALTHLESLNVKELELVEVAGTPFYIASLASGDTRIVPFDGPSRPAFDQAFLRKAIVEATASTGLSGFDVIDQYDRYYLDRRRELPLPVIRVRLNDGEHTRYYVDPRTARVVGNYSSRNWMTRWVYHGLHSLNFPWLYNHRPLWDIVVITFMLGGAALSVTAVILAWGVVGRRIGRLT